VNQGTVQLFFGAQPPADGKELLDSYLEWLVAEHGYLRLGKLLGKAQSGREQETVPALSLRAVYTSLATTAWVAGETFQLERAAILHAMDASDPSQVLPNRVRVAALQQAEGYGRDRPAAAWHLSFGGESLGNQWQAARRAVADTPNNAPLHGQWYRPETPLTALNAHPRLVLLGSPGSGKSTVLRYITIMLAEALLAGNDAERSRPIPLFCPLGRVAQDLGTNPKHDLDILVNALLRPVFGPGGLRDDLRAPILQAWRAGSALLCLDGLDEVPGVAEKTAAGQRSRRERSAAAIRRSAGRIVCGGGCHGVAGGGNGATGQRGTVLSSQFSVLSSLFPVTPQYHIHATIRPNSTKLPSAVASIRGSLCKGIQFVRFAYPHGSTLCSFRQGGSASRRCAPRGSSEHNGTAHTFGHPSGCNGQLFFRYLPPYSADRTSEGRRITRSPHCDR
jgi:hypothetical protein